MVEGERAARWMGPHADKDALRHGVWAGLGRDGVDVGRVRCAIPNLVGADAAAKHLTEMPAWTRTPVITCNPAAPRIPVRLRALCDRETVSAPVPDRFAAIRSGPIRGTLWNGRGE